MNKTNSKMQTYKNVLNAVVILFVIFSFHGIHAQPIDILSAQEYAESNNPKLKAMHQQTEAFKKRIPQAASLEDPKIKLGINNVPVTNPSLNNSDMTNKEIGVFQMIPLFGKLSVKEQIAVLDYKKTAEMYRFYKCLLLHDVRVNYYEIAYLREYIVILEKTKQYLALLLEIQKSRSVVAIGSLSDALKASVELSKIDEEIINVRNTIAEKEQMIRYLLGDGSLSGLTINTDALISTAVIEELSHNDAVNKIVADNPELQMMSLQILIDEMEIDYKQREYYPDMELGISYMQRDASPHGVKRDDMFSVMATFNIPAWFKNRNIPAVEERKLKKGESKELFNDKQNEITFAVSKIGINMQTWAELYTIFTKRIIPQLDAALQADLTQYKTANIEFMKLMDTIRMRLDYQKESLNVVKEYMIALSLLKFLAGDSSIEKKGF